MTDLVAALGSGTGTWTNVLMLAARPEFKNVFLIVNEWTMKSLKIERPNIHLIVVPDGNTSLMRDAVTAQMKGKINGLEAAVNLESGSGKEHMALLTGLMQLGISFRFVVLENNQLEEVSYDLHIPVEENEDF